MASQVKVGYLETENKSGGEDAQTLNGVNSSFFVVDLILRLLAIGCTFSAAIVMGTNKQTVILPIVGPWPAKYQYSPAFVFFVVANAVACGYTLISLIFSVTGKFASSTLSAFLLSVTDLVMVALVSAGVSAAAAVAYVGYKGNSHTHWRKLCQRAKRPYGPWEYTPILRGQTKEFIQWGSAGDSWNRERHFHRI